MNFFLAEVVGAWETLEEADKRYLTPESSLSLQRITFVVKHNSSIHFYLKIDFNTQL